MDPFYYVTNINKIFFRIRFIELSLHYKIENERLANRKKDWAEKLLNFHMYMSFLVFVY